MARRIPKNLLLAMVVAALGLAALPAMGATIFGTIGPPGCAADDCLGGQWTLEVSDTPVNAGYDLHVAFVASFPTAGLVDDEGSISPTDIVNVEFALPGDITGYVATNVLAASFLTSAGPLASSGCGGGNSNFLCATGSEPIVLGSSLTWAWDLTVSDVDAVFDPANADSFHLGAKVSSEKHPKGWLVSVNPIPEPNAAVVFSAGALTVGLALRKKLR